MASEEQRGRFWGGGSASDTESSGSDSDNDVRPEAPAGGGTHEWHMDSESSSEDEGRVVRSAKDKRWDQLRDVIKKISNALKINDWGTIQTEFDSLNRVLDKAKQVVAKEGVPSFYIRILIQLEDSMAGISRADLKKWNRLTAKAFNRVRMTITKNNANYTTLIEEQRKRGVVVSDASVSSSDSDSDSGSSSGSSGSSSSYTSGSGSDSSSGSSSSGSDSDSDSEDWDSSSDSDSDDSELGAGAISRDFWVKKDDEQVETIKRQRVQRKKEKKAAAVAVAAEMSTVWTAASLQTELLDLLRIRGRRGVNRKRMARDNRILGIKSLVYGPKTQLPILMALVSAQFDISVMKTIDAHLPRDLWIQVLIDVNTIVDILAANPDLELAPLESLELTADAVARAEKADKAGILPVASGAASAGAAAAQAATPPVPPSDTTEDATGEAEPVNGRTAVRVVGQLGLMIQRLSAEFTKSLQQMDPHTHEFIERIRDEQALCHVADKVFDYYSRVNNTEAAVVVAMLRMEHMYYKHDSIAHSLQKLQPDVPTSFEAIQGRMVAAAVEAEAAARAKAAEKAAAIAAASGDGAKAAPPNVEAMVATAIDEARRAVVIAAAQRIFDAPLDGKEKLPAPGAVEEKAAGDEESKGSDSTSDAIPLLRSVSRSRAADPVLYDVATRLDTLAKFIFAKGKERVKARTMLCQIYYLSIHDKFFQARDLMLMSHLQDHINAMDESTQILYNRATAQLGLCAFRCGMIKECHMCLQEVSGIGRPKELLAQGMPNMRQQDRNPEAEKAARRRQVPYHMHINLDLLEACHLTSAMLLEVPNMAAAEHNLRRRRISSTYRKQLDHLENKTFVGPPENTRDCVMAAGQALAVCNWRRAADLLTGLKVWALWAHLDVPRVKHQLVEHVKREALRTFMFTYAPYYDSISHTFLADTFDMTKPQVHRVISKMMIEEDVSAAWDQPTNSILMHRVEPSRLQSLCLEYADKVATFVDSNEMMMDARTGGEFSEQTGTQRRRRRDLGGRRTGGFDSRASSGRTFGYYARRGRGGRGSRGGRSDNRRR